MLITIIIQSKHTAVKIFKPLILDAHTQKGNSDCTIYYTEANNILSLCHLLFEDSTTVISRA